MLDNRFKNAMFELIKECSCVLKDNIEVEMLICISFLKKSENRKSEDPKFGFFFVKLDLIRLSIFSFLFQ